MDGCAAVALVAAASARPRAARTGVTLTVGGVRASQSAAGLSRRARDARGTTATGNIPRQQLYRSTRIVQLVI